MQTQSIRKAVIASFAASAMTLGASTAFAANDVIDPSSKLFVNWFSGAPNAASRLTGAVPSKALMLAGFAQAANIGGDKLIWHNTQDVDNFVSSDTTSSRASVRAQAR